MFSEDADLGRVYLPTEDLDQFGVSPADLRSTERTEAFLQLDGIRSQSRTALLRRVPAR